MVVIILAFRTVPVVSVQVKVNVLLALSDSYKWVNASQNVIMDSSNKATNAFNAPWNAALA